MTGLGLQVQGVVLSRHLLPCPSCQALAWELLLLRVKQSRPMHSCRLHLPPSWIRRGGCVLQANQVYQGHSGHGIPSLLPDGYVRCKLLAKMVRCHASHTHTCQPLSGRWNVT